MYCSQRDERARGDAKARYSDVQESVARRAVESNARANRYPIHEELHNERLGAAQTGLSVDIHPERSGTNRGVHDRVGRRRRGTYVAWRHKLLSRVGNAVPPELLIMKFGPVNPATPAKEPAARALSRHTPTSLVETQVETEALDSGRMRPGEGMSRPTGGRPRGSLDMPGSHIRTMGKGADGSRLLRTRRSPWIESSAPKLYPWLPTGEVSACQLPRAAVGPSGLLRRLSEAPSLPHRSTRNLVFESVGRVAAHRIEELLGFWVLWQTSGGFEGLQLRFGMSESTIFRRVSLFRELFVLTQMSLTCQGSQST